MSSTSSTFALQDLKDIQAAMKRWKPKPPKTKYKTSEAVPFLYKDMRRMFEKGCTKSDIADIFAAKGYKVSPNFWRFYNEMSGNEQPAVSTANEATGEAADQTEATASDAPQDASANADTGAWDVMQGDGQATQSEPQQQEQAPQEEPKRGGLLGGFFRRDAEDL